MDRYIPMITATMTAVYAITALVLATAGIAAFFHYRSITGKKEIRPVWRYASRAVFVFSVLQFCIAVLLLSVRYPILAAGAGKVLAVTGVSALELWGGIPLGFAFGLHPVLIAGIAILGTTACTALVIFGGTAVRERFLKKKRKKKNGAVMRVWNAFGIIGLGLVAPWITGAPIGAAIAVSLKSDPKRTLLWMIIGIMLCAVLLTAFGAFGVSLFQHRE